ncbi:MAG: hypothetical protein IT305_22690 [Chloroflexi bacterium]|nr:hypothetical protein [Chloroflexota bacterium]
MGRVTSRAAHSSCTPGQEPPPGDQVRAAAEASRSVRRGLLHASLALAIWSAVALVTPTFLSAPIWLSSDAGVFYAVFHQLNQGHRLYADVFDHKDPLFYAGYSAAYAVAGLRGPMLWEAILSFVLLLAVLELGALSGLGATSRTLLALVFASVHFLPTVYIPVHTYQQALALFSISLCLAASDRAGLAGAAFAAAVLSKLTLAAYAPGFCLFAALSGATGSAWRDRLVRAALGGTAVVCGAAGGLYLRGELGGYVDALLVNLWYPALNPSDLTSFVNTPDLWGRAVTLFTIPVTSVYLVLVTLSAGLIFLVDLPSSRRTAIGASAWLALLVFGGTVAILHVASWWAHHFQMAGLALVLALLPVLAATSAARASTWRPRLVLWRGVGMPRASLFVPSVALAATLGVPMLLLGLVGPVLASHVTVQRFDLSPPDPCQVLVSVYAWRGGRHPECSLLKQRWPAGTRFATIQGNDPGGLAAWTPPTMILACRVFYQFVWLEPALLDETERCLEDGGVDVVFRSPLTGDYGAVQKPFLEILRSSYRLTHRYGDIEVWTRRT